MSGVELVVAGLVAGIPIGYSLRAIGLIVKGRG